jgi:methylamine dehydrogenase accessory protein MauD
MAGLWLISYIALWAFVILEAVVILALMRQVGLLHLRLGATGARLGNTGPELGERAPEITGYDVNSGRSVKLSHSIGKSTMLVFISPGCSSCDDLMPGVVALDHHEKDTNFIVVSDLADDRANREFIKRDHLNGIQFIANPKIVDDYHIGGSPYAVLVDAQGIVRSKGLVNHLEHLESLLNARDLGLDSYDSLMKMQTRVKEERAI